MRIEHIYINNSIFPQRSLPFLCLLNHGSTTSIECCYQNVGIATSVALAMFEGDELAEAMGVPLYYGGVEAFVLGIYCIGAWKMSWTKAPADDPILKVISTSYEVLYAEATEKSAQAKNCNPVVTDTEMGYVKHEDGDSNIQPPDLSPLPSPGMLPADPARRFAMPRDPKEPSFSKVKLQQS